MDFSFATLAENSRRLQSSRAASHRQRKSWNVVELIEISIARRRGVRSFVETARRLMAGIVSFIAASDGRGWGSRINAVRDVKGQCRATASP